MNNFVSLQAANVDDKIYSMFYMYNLYVHSNFVHYDFYVIKSQPHPTKSGVRGKQEEHFCKFFLSFPPNMSDKKGKKDILL